MLTMSNYPHVIQVHRWVCRIVEDHCFIEKCKRQNQSLVAKLDMQIDIMRSLVALKVLCRVNQTGLHNLACRSMSCSQCFMPRSLSVIYGFHDHLYGFTIKKLDSTE